MRRDDSRSRIVQELAERMRRLERSRSRPDGPREACLQSPPEDKTPAGDVLSSGISPLDELLPAGGLRRGTLVEWLADGEGTGAATLALTVAAHLMRDTGALVLLDGSGEFYPPAAAALGIDPDRTVLVRPSARRHLLWTFEQSLRCPGVAVSWCPAGELDDRVFRRLQLAAEAGGGLGFLMRPARVCRQPSWADASLLVQSLPSPGPLDAGRRLRVELLRCRNGTSGGAVELHLLRDCHETGVVRSSSGLASAAPAQRAAGA